MTIFLVLKKAKLAAIGATTEDTQKSDFNKESYKPKVQIPFTVPPGNKPRRVQIERDRRTTVSYFGEISSQKENKKYSFGVLKLFIFE